MKQQFKVDCSDCGATGLYLHDRSCQKGEAVVCRACGGKGYRIIEFEVFTYCKIALGVEKVRLCNNSVGDQCGQGSWAGHGSTSVTYAEFVAGQMPQVTELEYCGQKYVRAQGHNGRLRLCEDCGNFDKRTRCCRNSEACLIFGLGDGHVPEYVLNGQDLGFFCPHWKRPE
ncbi:MAG: hypothetical protein US42_C0009G0018 [Candidatus Magasanikbacteria bacterium GW2011_GWC2_37_14]|uniref:Uncharacterized protein n=1 Tax=Candidatus Magasanikbacteria bacterium GW2011_GWC2_37_14 TaxID=1619046 RepID=A0A0G0G8L1_9BACT|nr:MAG: hypothetical protein US42_C0009G0018 [Candidatus Magasanikbacteria bacterium GW2011_GWC2_37_14]